LSNAKNEHLTRLTEETIESLLNSEDPGEFKFHIIVVESNQSLKPFQFNNTKTIYPDEQFGFHKFLNIGIKTGNSEYVCLCNNDLIFHKGWASATLGVFQKHPEFDSANPLCDLFEPHKKIDTAKPYIIANKKNIFQGILTGWCIFARRSLFNKIGLLDEQFDFWYADRDYGRTLLKFGLKHVLVPGAIVTHLGNQSHESIDTEKLNELTSEQRIKYERKWGSDATLFQRLKLLAKKIMR
jgi:GT2 family glycosyltransferase